MKAFTTLKGILLFSGAVDMIIGSGLFAAAHASAAYQYLRLPGIVLLYVGCATIVAAMVWPQR